MSETLTYEWALDTTRLRSGTPAKNGEGFGAELAAVFCINVSVKPEGANMAHDGYTNFVGAHSSNAVLGAVEPVRGGVVIFDFAAVLDQNYDCMTVGCWTRKPGEIWDVTDTHVCSVEVIRGTLNLSRSDLEVFTTLARRQWILFSAVEEK